MNPNVPQQPAPPQPQGAIKPTPVPTPAKEKPAPKIPKAKTRHIEDLLEDVKIATDYVESNYHGDWRNFYRIYRNQRVSVNYEGYSDAFIPESFTIVESLVANIAGGKPKFEFLPTDEEQKQETKVLNQLMQYIWDANLMDQKAQIWVREMLQYGTGVLYITWDAIRNLPKIQNIPIYDFIFDPTATSLDNAGYLGFRYLANRSDLEAMQVVDPETGEYKPMYNLSKIEDGQGSTGPQTDKEIKDALKGSTVPDTAENTQIEVIVLHYADGGVYHIGNRQEIILSDDSPFQKEAHTVETSININGMPTPVKRKIPAIRPFKPFAILRDYVDPSQLLGSGEIEVIMDRQETLNDVENMDLDNMAYANNIMWQIDPQYIDLMPEISAAPGLVVPIPQGALQPIQRPQATIDLDAKKAEITSEMRRATAADEAIQGASQDQGRITATEVNTQLTQSHMRFSTKLNNLESEGYAQLADVLLKTCQIFLDQPTAIRIVGDEGVYWEDFDPNDFTGEYEPHVKLDTTVKQMKMEQGQKLNQMYQLILNNPYINQQEALKFIFTNLGADKDEVLALLAQTPMLPMEHPKVTVQLRGMLGPQETDSLGATALPPQQQQPALQQPGMPG